MGCNGSLAFSLLATSLPRAEVIVAWMKSSKQKIHSEINVNAGSGQRTSDDPQNAHVLRRDPKCSWLIADLSEIFTRRKHGRGGMYWALAISEAASKS